MSSQQNFEKYEKRLLRVLAYIYENLDHELSLDTLADVAHMSRFHWHRVFSAMTGETLSDAVRRLRLHKAANTLVLEDTPVSEVAKRVGFSNKASFSRAFSSAYGMPPIEYRARGVEVSNELIRNSAQQKMFPVTISDLQPKKAAGVLHTGSYAHIGAAFQRLGGILSARALFPHVAGLFVVYHDAPGSKPAAQLRAHVAVERGDCFPSEVEGLDYFDVYGGRYAIMKHRGPYATLKAAYTWLYGTWLPQSGEDAGDAPPIEFYVNDPRTTRAADLRTDIRVPLS